MKRKLDNILRKRESHAVNDRWVGNMSSRTLSTPEKSILSKGLNFAPAPKRIPISRMVIAVENGPRGVDECVAGRII